MEANTITIETPNDYYSESDGIFLKRKISLCPGLTILVGCNGTGKTTFLQMIDETCREKGIPIFRYNNIRDGGHVGLNRLLSGGDIKGFARNIQSSEGENIVNNLAISVPEIGKFVRSNENAKQLVITIDAIDSGLSIDGIVELKTALFQTIIKDCKSHDQDVYIVAAANSYEMANGESCLDVRNGKYKTFKCYEDYRAFVLKTREVKDKRYGFTKNEN